jgi:hypothetical protein
MSGGTLKFNPGELEPRVVDFIDVKVKYNVWLRKSPWQIQIECRQRRVFARS